MNGEEEIAAEVARAEAEAKAKAARKTGQAGQSGKAQRARRKGFPFKNEGGQLWREVDAEGGDGKRYAAFGSELHVLARTRTTEGEGHGLLLELSDPDGIVHQWAMPGALLAGTGEPIRAQLFDMGWRPVAGAGRKWRDWLLEYLITAQPEQAARCVPSTGWHGATFVLPDETFGGASDSERVILQTAAPLDHAFRQAGTLEAWQAEVARPALGNSRLVLAMSAAFAATLLAPMGDDGGGFHLRGGSSVGKSTALFVAGSVWGGGGVRGYVQNWRATDNALESTAALHDGALLALDELSQVEPKAAGAAAYMLANGKGKARAGKEGQARRAHEWQLLFLSTGEISLGDKIREGGGQIAAGMEVRVIDLPADAGAGKGLFEELHGAADPAAFAQALRASAGRHYGTASRAFLRELVRDLDAAKAMVAELRRAFTDAALQPGADGQVRRVADRFALAAAAGDLASAYGITGWPAGAACEAALRCFKDWVAERGGMGSGESAEARRRLIDAIETYGKARFDKWHANADRAVITPRWGFVKTHGDPDQPLEAHEFFILPSSMREILHGLDNRTVIAGLIGRGINPQGPKGEASKVFHVPGGGGKHRLYQLDLVALRRGDGPADD